MLQIIAVIVIAWAILHARSYRRLSHIPGPFLAKLTNIPRFTWVLSNKAHDIHVSLHRKYGPLVRLGPNIVSFADPKEVGHVYAFSNPLSGHVLQGLHLD
ncbi:hypothetical protein BDW68DRAFT_135868 [Aspergillus falconensis]